VTVTRRAWTAWAAICILWGTTYLAIRIAIETIPPLLMAGARWLIAGTLLAVVLKARGERMPPPREWAPLVVLGILLPGVGNGGVVWAEQTLSSGITAVLVATAPFWMVGFEALMPGGERLSARHTTGLLVGFAGIVALVWPEVAGHGGAHLGGVAAAQLACAGWAAGSIYSRRHAPGANVLTIAAFEMLFGGIALLAAASVDHEWRHLVVTPRTFGAFAYLVVFGSIAGYTAYAYALKHLPIATVSLYAYVNPVIAVVLGTIVLGEPFTPRIAAAAAVVLAGMWLVRRPAAR
jgi:drug/metabolite transporter (DMT)-like permease